jgi:hypothetical protein
MHSVLSLACLSNLRDAFIRWTPKMVAQIALPVEVVVAIVAVLIIVLGPRTII